MRCNKSLVTLFVATLAMGQRPSNTSICDYYTTALLKNNTAENQYTILTLVVNTAVIGNYTMPNVGVKVAGILAPGTFNGTSVNLLPYFNGQLASSNRGGSSGVGINFLDGGGATPLMKNMPANDNTSNQYFLLTHLYEFFGALLQCSQMGQANSAFPPYSGHTSMYDVHKFMDLGPAELGYFIQQVGMSAASFGVTADDVTAVGTALTSLFAMRCAPPAQVIPTASGKELQAICLRDACPLAQDAVCTAYAPAVMPQNATSTVSGSGTATTTAASTTKTTATITPVVTAGAAMNSLSLVALAGGFAALML